LTTEFQAKYYDKLTNFRINIKSEEDRLLKQTLMRIKSIKVKDNYSLNNIITNDNMDSLFMRNKQKIEYLEASDLDSKLEREKMIILRKFQRNNIENAKKITFLSQTLNNNRIKTNIQSLNEEKLKNSVNKKVLETYRPKTVKNSRPLFNESVDGCRIDIRNNITSQLNSSNLESSETNRNTTNSRVGTNEINPDSLSFRSNYFPRINNHAHTSLNLNSPISSRRDKLIKQPLKTKSAKLLFYDQTDVFHDSWYSNDYGKWLVDDGTNKKFLRDNKKKKNYYKRELKAVLNNTLPEPPSTTPISHLLENDSLKSRSTRPKTSRTTAKTPPSVIINKINKNDENRMNIQDLIRYMKPIDNLSIESKSNENFANDNNEKVLSYNKTNDQLFNSLSNMNLAVNQLKPERFELSIKIPLDNEQCIF
jgi:hypothetical protein